MRLLANEKRLQVLSPQIKRKKDFEHRHTRGESSGHKGQAQTAQRTAKRARKQLQRATAQVRSHVFSALSSIAPAAHFEFHLRCATRFQATPLIEKKEARSSVIIVLLPTLRSIPCVVAISTSLPSIGSKCVTLAGPTNLPSFADHGLIWTVCRCW